MPSTLPCALSTPAISRDEPLIVLSVAERDLAFALDPVERRIIGEIVAIMVRDRNVDRLALAHKGW